jgi:type IX secretion system PorP/SprF family membrane protein
VPYRTGGLSAEVNFPVNDYGHYLTAGTQLLYDVAGDSKLTRTHILPVLGYHAPIVGSDVYLSGAIMGGVVSSNFDPTKLRWDDQFVGGSYNPTNPTRQLISSTARTYFDIGAGLAVSGPATDAINFYLGTAVYHANNPNIAFDNEDIRLGRKWAFNGGLSIETSDWNRLTFYADYFLQKAAESSDSIARLGSQNTFMLGAFYTTDLQQYDMDDVMSLTFGAVYRLNDAIAPVVRFDVKKFGIGLSYDVNVSNLTKASQARGGFELTLGFKSDFTRRKSRSYRMECVDFVR